ncbi:MAG TPA: MoaD/ThiS family protein [Acidimicrobiia bacterium]|nr:MoaD/ThiS family protein [Acidimicrobiia bacterium]
MTVKVRLPRILDQAVKEGLRHEVTGQDVHEVLQGLFDREPGVRNHLIDEDGRIRTHVLVFVDGERAELSTPVSDGAEVQVLQAVSGG